MESYHAEVRILPSQPSSQAFGGCQRLRICGKYGLRPRRSSSVAAEYSAAGSVSSATQSVRAMPAVVW